MTLRACQALVLYKCKLLPGIKYNAGATCNCVNGVK